MKKSHNPAPHDFNPRAGESPYDYHKRQATELLAHYLNGSRLELDQVCKDEIGELVEHIGGMVLHAIGADVTRYVEGALASAYGTIANMTSEIMMMRGAAALRELLSKMARPAEQDGAELAAAPAGSSTSSWSGRVWEGSTEAAADAGELHGAELDALGAWIAEDTDATANTLRELGFDVSIRLPDGARFDELTARRPCRGGGELEVSVAIGRRVARLSRPRQLYPADTLAAAAVSRWISTLFGGADALDELVN